MDKIKVMMRFPPNMVTKPITYHLVKDFDLQINILHADIHLNKTGKLIADISGEQDNIRRGLEFIREQGVEYSIFNKGVIWKEDRCVHCGACTAVCPSGALWMDGETWSLMFDKEKCLVCSLCVSTCPLGVITVIDNGNGRDTPDVP